jgi:hypothetical protein
VKHLRHTALVFEGAHWPFAQLRPREADKVVAIMRGHSGMDHATRCFSFTCHRRRLSMLCTRTARAAVSSMLHLISGGVGREVLRELLDRRVEAAIFDSELGVDREPLHDARAGGIRVIEAALTQRRDSGRALAAVTCDPYDAAANARWPRPGACLATASETCERFLRGLGDAAADIDLDRGPIFGLSSLSTIHRRRLSSVVHAYRACGGITSKIGSLSAGLDAPTSMGVPAALARVA